jgi:hypothetical protein
MPREISAKERAFNASEEQKKRRAQRNKARRKAIREGRARKGDGKEVHHTRANRKGKLSGPTRVVSKRTNRKKQPKRDGSQD